MRQVIRPIAVLMLTLPIVAGCGGMVRAVKVLPDTADQLCRETQSSGNTQNADDRC